MFNPDDWSFVGFKVAARAYRLAKTIGMLDWYDGSISPIAAEDGKFFSSADGGYPFIFISRENDVFCADCASDPVCAQLDDDRTRICDVDIFYEGPPETCTNCGKEIESAYGDPAADDDEVKS